MTIWYPDSCHCICHVENQDLLVRCNAHTTYAQTLLANQTLNLKFGNMEFPTYPDRFDFESDRDVARRKNDTAALLTLDRFDEIAADRAAAKASSTITDLEQRRKAALRNYLAKPLEERKRTKGEPTRTQLETEVDR